MISSHVPFTYEDRQWDCRFNVQEESYLQSILKNVVTLCTEAKRIKYALVGGVEIGTRPYQDDYQIRHVNCAFIFINRVSKSQLLKLLGIKLGNGYYCVPRNRDLPYSGWKEHHTKAYSKVNEGSTILYEYGILPADINKKVLCASETEKRLTINEILKDMRVLLKEKKDEECFQKYPRNYLLYAEKIKAMMHQSHNFDKKETGCPHIWVYGYAGTGKTALLAFIYPNYYKKNLYNKFFDLYNSSVHTHIILEDLDHQAVDRLGINFIKTLCDEAGFPIDQKYKTPQMIKTTVLVTSNFTINQLVAQQEHTAGLEQNIAALLRRFMHIRIDALFQLLGLKLIPKWDRVKLQKDGNTDLSRLFITWDYISDTPLCTEVKEPTYYQHLIRDYYFNVPKDKT